MSFVCVWWSGCRNPTFSAAQHLRWWVLFSYFLELWYIFEFFFSSSTFNNTIFYNQNHQDKKSSLTTVAILLVSFFSQPQRIIVGLTSSLICFFFGCHTILEYIVPSSHPFEFVLINQTFMLFVLLTHVMLLRGVEPIDLWDELPSFFRWLDKWHIGVT